ncbi:MAG: hypothetical protein Q7R95_01175, partial [bacterium]|nr:hypothetical protein [bacterium]
LPEWAKIIAKFVPTTYVFEEMRSLAKTGNLDGSQLLISLFLNSLYLVLSLLFLQSSFKKVLQKGLVKIY